MARFKRFRAAYGRARTRYSNYRKRRSGRKNHKKKTMLEYAILALGAFLIWKNWATIKQKLGM